MKYKVDQKEVGKFRIGYILIDECGLRHNWVEWLAYDIDEALTRYREFSGNWIEVNARIQLNENNPQESIDRIKKLQVLK
jgi:hypothetical protein